MNEMTRTIAEMKDRVKMATADTGMSAKRKRCAGLVQREWNRRKYILQIPA
ncbi:MAG: hypothetical protein IKV66_09070 [Clostridia bacterium]|nr:hypothetical protein [Clostridia bacterium]